MLFILVLIVIFCGERLPGVARNIGKTVSDIKRSFDGAKQDLINTANTDAHEIKPNPQRVSENKDDFNSPYTGEKTLAG